MRLLEDVRYALRQLWNAPGYAATAIATLALGTGATTSIFTLAHAILLMSLPVAKPSELYRVGSLADCCVNGGLQDDWSLFSYDKYKTFRDQTPGFSELAAFQAGGTTIGVRRSGTNVAAQPQRIEYVSGNYFAMFGIGPFAGRTLAAADDHPGADPVVVMSYGAWQQKYGRDPSVVGSVFHMNGQAVTVVGIAAPGFFGDRLEGLPAFWIPLCNEPLINASGSILNLPEQDWLDLIGRLTPGADPTAMEARMQVELRQWLLGPLSTLTTEERPLVSKQMLHLAPGGGGVQGMRDSAKSGIRLLLWVSAFVLLIACANVANLMLARATTRKLQTSIRAALGASRWRQIRLILTESVVLAILGGLVGIVIAYGLTALIIRLVFQRMEVALHASPSWPVLGFTFFVALLTGVLFGVAPAWLSMRADPADALRGATRSASGRSGWAQQVLVVVQAAISLVLLCAAGLMAQSLRNMQDQHFGFEPKSRYVVHYDPLMAGYKPEGLDILYQELRRNIGGIPGVARVSFSLYSPMEGDNWSETVFIQGQPPPPPDSTVNNASWVRVSDQYFETIGTKIVKGRAITDQDSSSTLVAAVVNQTFAKKFFKDSDAIGHHFGITDAKYASLFEIVGVSEDTQYGDPARTMRPMYFLAGSQAVTYSDPRFARFEDRSHYLRAIEFETKGAVLGLEPLVRHAIAQVNPDLAVIDFMTLENQVAINFSPHTMVAQMTGLFGLLALALASVGLYGVTAYSVERRTSEIGVRMALGANKMKILGLVLTGAFRQVAIGLAIGIPGTILAGRAVASQLYQVKPYDPVILVSMTLALGIAGLFAVCVPARRAASLDPIEALRTE